MNVAVKRTRKLQSGMLAVITHPIYFSKPAKMD